VVVVEQEDLENHNSGSYTASPLAAAALTSFNNIISNYSWWWRSWWYCSGVQAMVQIQFFQLLHQQVGWGGEIMVPPLVNTGGSGGGGVEAHLAPTCGEQEILLQ
jgi:hypothetical protein